MVRRQRWKEKVAQTLLCHSTPVPVRTFSLTPHPIHVPAPIPTRLLLCAPFVPCSLPPSCHPYTQSSRSSQPATLQQVARLSDWQIGVARFEVGVTQRRSVVSGCASPSPSPFSPPPNRIALWRAHSNAVIASAYSASPFRVKVSALSPSAHPIRRWNSNHTRMVCSTETY